MVSMPLYVNAIPSQFPAAPPFINANSVSVDIDPLPPALIDVYRASTVLDRLIMAQLAPITP